MFCRINGFFIKIVIGISLFISHDIQLLILKRNIGRYLHKTSKTSTHIQECVKLHKTLLEDKLKHCKANCLRLKRDTLPLFLSHKVGFFTSWISPYSASILKHLIDPRLTSLSKTQMMFLAYISGLTWAMSRWTGLDQQCVW